MATHRLAWRSFWLGISSILLLMFTGIPAIYYGVRSLLRMRFIKPSRSDRAAAIVGTTLGGCFGIFVGFIAVSGLIVMLIGFWTFAETSDPSDVARQCREYFEFSSPHVGPVHASSMANARYVFDFADEPELEDRKLRVLLAFVRTGIQSNDGVIVGDLKEKRLGNTDYGEIHESEFLNWQFNDQAIDVKKSVYSQKLDPDSDSTVATHRQYWGYVRRPDGLYGMAVVFDPSSYDFSDADVKQMFASTRVNDASR